MMPRPEISVVIVNRNTCGILEECLTALFNDLGGIDAEVIVVDNGSDDNSVRMLKTEFENRVSVIENTENLGYAKASNQGIAASAGNVVLLLNSDTAVRKGCIGKIIGFMRERTDAGIVGCRVLNPDGTLQYSCYRAPTALTESVFFTKTIIKNFWDPVTYYKYMKYWDHKTARPVDCVSGCFLAARRDLLDKVGMLDEKMFMYYEDTDFCLRAVKTAYYKVYYYPDAVTVHRLGGTPACKDDRILAAFDSAVYYIKKHHGELRARLFVFICRLIWTAEILIFGIFPGNVRLKEKLKLLKGLKGAAWNETKK